MKRLFCVLMIMSVLWAGCGSVELEFDSDIENVRQHTIAFATGGGDLTKFSEDISLFNAKLDEVKTKDEIVNAFVEAQRKANDLRLEAFREMDYDKINESTGYQARALELYHEIKERKSAN